MREKLELVLAKGLIGVSKYLPIPFVYKVFELLATIVYMVDPNRRELTKKNLKEAGFSKDLAIKSYKEIAKTLAEALLILTNRFDFNKIEGEFLSKTSKPKIFVTAHFGNWEALAHYLAMSGYPMSVVGRKGNNILIEEQITTPFRKLYGNDLIYKEGALKQLIKRLAQGKNIGLLIDQKAGRDGMVTTFLGRECKTVPTVALLAKKFDVEVVPIFLVRTENGFKLIQKEFEADPNDIVAFTQKLNDTLEEVIKEYPDQWFWMHNRWKMG